MDKEFPMKKSTALVIAASTLLMLTGCGGGVSPSQSATEEVVEVSTNGKPLTLGLTYVPNVQFSPVYVAAEDSIFTSAGLGVSVRHHGADEGLFSALISGDEDVVIASGDEVLQARAQGVDIVSIGAFYQEYPVEIIVPEDSSITSFVDLKGKRVGLPGEFGSSWFGLLAALDEAGLTRDDITVVPVGYTQAASLVSGEVDAIVGFSNSDAVQLQEMDFAARSLPLPDDVPLVGASIITTQAWLDENERNAKHLVDSLTAAMDKIAANPTYALEVSAKWDDTLSDPGARAGAKATLAATIPLWVGEHGADATQDLERWEKMGPFLAEVLGDPAVVEYAEGAVTNQYVNQ